MVGTRGPGFLGRTTEREVLDGLLARVREGESEVLVIRGEAGIGKTALLRYAARQASGFQVAQLTGGEAEMELPFAGIHQLWATLPDHLGALPAPQRNALSVALGLVAGDVPDAFLVSLAVLSLLSSVAAERPLLCLVEDAQWLDAASSQILGFVPGPGRGARSWDSSRAGCWASRWSWSSPSATPRRRPSRGCRSSRSQAWNEM